MKVSRSPRFELSINGDVVAVAGLHGFGVLNGMLTWVRRDPKTVPEEERQLLQARGGCLAEERQLQLGGLDAIGDMRWVDQGLCVGDVIEVRVLPPGACTPSVRYDRCDCDAG